MRPLILLAMLASPLCADEPSTQARIADLEQQVADLEEQAATAGSIAIAAELKENEARVNAAILYDQNKQLRTENKRLVEALNQNIPGHSARTANETLQGASDRDVHLMPAGVAHGEGAHRLASDDGIRWRPVPRRVITSAGSLVIENTYTRYPVQPGGNDEGSSTFRQNADRRTYGRANSDGEFLRQRVLRSIGQ